MRLPIRILARSIGFAALYAALGPMIGYFIFFVVMSVSHVPSEGLGALFGVMVSFVLLSIPQTFPVIYSAALPAALTGGIVGMTSSVTGRLPTLAVASLAGFLTTFAYGYFRSPGTPDAIRMLLPLGVTGAATAFVLALGTARRLSPGQDRHGVRGLGDGSD